MHHTNAKHTSEPNSLNAPQYSYEEYCVGASGSQAAPTRGRWVSVSDWNTCPVEFVCQSKGGAIETGDANMLVTDRAILSQDGLYFLMAVREGATDAQIAHALRQGLPHLTDPVSLQD